MAWEEYDDQGYRPSMMRVRVMPAGKPPRPAEVLTEDEMNIEWI